jgi:hypothetical protein
MSKMLGELLYLIQSLGRKTVLIKVALAQKKAMHQKNQMEGAETCQLPSVTLRHDRHWGKHTLSNWNGDDWLSK